MRLSETQTRWLAEIRRRGRARYGAAFHAGCPERTADALRRRGLVRLETQPVFLKSAGGAGPTGTFVVPL